MKKVKMFYGSLGDVEYKLNQFMQENATKNETIQIQIINDSGTTSVQVVAALLYEEGMTIPKESSNS